MSFTLPRFSICLLWAGIITTPAFAEPAMDLAKLPFTCMVTDLMRCKVLTSGVINDHSDGGAGEPLLAWQTQAGATAAGESRGGVVGYEWLNGAWSVLNASTEAWRYELPVFNEDDVLHIAGNLPGTGNLNADRVFRRSPIGRWASIDVQSWKSQASDLLPPGLTILKGVDYDLSNIWSGMVARTELWRPTDANCCPTGGQAVIRLEFSGDAFVATEIELTPEF